MSKEKIYIFDTTLRDGAQTQGVNFSMNEKNRIANALSKLGVDYIEAGWPGANPLDTNFFNKPPKLLIQILSPFVSLEKHGIFTLM
jgi:2-isopropylmalate synthase